MTLKLDKQKALLVLALDDAKPTGLRPTLLEIDLWRRGKLKKNRRNEVQSFIAHDSDCYQLWLDLLETEEDLTVEKAKKPMSLSQSLSNWLANFKAGWVGGGLAFATASVLVAVVTLKTLTQPDLLSRIDGDYAQFSGDPLAVNWYFPSNDKSLDITIPSTYDLLKPAVLTGIQTGLVSLQQAGKLADNPAWNDVITSYPKTLPACPDKVSAELCQQQQALLQEFGRNLALMQLYCAQPTEMTSANFYTEQEQRLELFKEKLSAYSDLAPLSEQLNIGQPGTDKQVFCTYTQRLSTHTMK